MRLAKIKPAVDQIAQESWEETVIGGERAKRMERVLDVRQGELCWVAGTVYMEMPLKPDVLEDVTKDVSDSVLVLVTPASRSLSKLMLFRSVGYPPQLPPRDTST